MIKLTISVIFLIQKKSFDSQNQSEKFIICEKKNEVFSKP